MIGPPREKKSQTFESRARAHSLGALVSGKGAREVDRYARLLQIGRPERLGVVPTARFVSACPFYHTLRVSLSVLPHSSCQLVRTFRVSLSDLPHASRQLPNRFWGADTLASESGRDTGHVHAPLRFTTRFVSVGLFYHTLRVSLVTSCGGAPALSRSIRSIPPIWRARASSIPPQS